jgi:hypothetical protein
LIALDHDGLAAPYKQMSMAGIQNISNVTDQTDRRASPRRDLIAEARLRHADVIIPCILQNISEGGAMIMVDPGVELPQNFLFEIPGNIAVGRRCSLVWRQGRFAGMEFIDRRKRTPTLI